MLTQPAATEADQVFEQIGLIHRTMTADAEAPFEWQHYCMLNSRVESHLSDALGIPPFIASAMVAVETRSRIIIRPEGIMVLLKALRQHDGAQPEMMVSLRLWIEADRLISAREYDIAAIVELYQEIEAGRGPATPANFLAHTIQHVYDEFDPMIDLMETELEALEAFVEREETLPVCNRLSHLERRAAIYLRHLSPQVTIFEILQSTRHPAITQGDQDHLAELSSRLRGMLETLQSIRDRADIIDQRIQRIEEFRQSAASSIFAAVATFFLPASFVAGLFGVNVGGVPWEENPWGFIFLFLLSVSLMGASYTLARKKGWL